MASKSWKVAELKMARDVNTERIPVTGERHGADFEDAIACYQLKVRKSIPGWLWDWHSGICETGKRKDKAGVLVLNHPRQDRAKALVVLTWDAWRDLHGTPTEGDDL